LTVILLASPATAARQATWIAEMEPWRGLGFKQAGLARFLHRAARGGQVWLASATRRGSALGLLVLQPDVLLGNFVSVLAVRPDAAGQGIGRRLMTSAQDKTFANRRWLFVSADATNRRALAFYRKLGFTRVARLPHLVREGRTEILLRKGQVGGARRPRKQAVRR
jgi:ribosomal protein S18 acetylase RimI-like enzyme